MLDARMTTGVHEAEVARLVQAYAALPPGAPVRLAKRTSNLFRFRDAAADATAGLERIVSPAAAAALRFSSCERLIPSSASLRQNSCSCASWFSI